MSSMWPGEHCQWYRAGHLVHHIQASHSRWEPRDPRPGRVVAIDGTTVTIDVDGEVRVYRNHATLRLAQLTFTLGPRVIIDEGWAILKLYQQSEELLFSIASADKEWTPCRAAGLSELDLCPLGEVLLADGGADGRLIIGDPRE